MAAVGDRVDFSHISNVEVTHTPGEDFAVAPKLLKGPNCVLKRVITTPMQEIAVQPVGLKASQRSFARRYRPASRRILGKNLRNQEDLIAPANDCFRGPLLGAAG